MGRGRTHFGPRRELLGYTPSAMHEPTETSARERALVAALQAIADGLARIRIVLERIDDTMNEARPHFGLPKREDIDEDGSFKSRYDEGD